jgi:DNA-binding response OmpR family regulator
LVADDFLLKPVDLQTLLSCVQARVRSCPHPSAFAGL